MLKIDQCDKYSGLRIGEISENVSTENLPMRNSKQNMYDSVPKRNTKKALRVNDAELVHSRAHEGSLDAERNPVGDRLEADVGWEKHTETARHSA